MVCVLLPVPQIIGDVGFGKTEVAIRAIFRAISSRRQARALPPQSPVSRMRRLYCHVLRTPRCSPLTRSTTSTLLSSR